MSQIYSTTTTRDRDADLKPVTFDPAIVFDGKVYGVADTSSPAFKNEDDAYKTAYSLELEIKGVVIQYLLDHGYKELKG
jgi:hypothetical protein